jgi:hypothetical protein
MWWKTIISSVVGFFATGAMAKIQKSIPAIVAEVEKAMVDGKITADERKTIAMATINSLAIEFGVSLNPILKWVISNIVDNVAKKLPSQDIMLKVSGKF